MEGILGIIGVIVLWWVGSWLFGIIFGAGKATVKAAAKTATGKGSFSDNMKSEFVGMGPLKIRINKTNAGDDEGEGFLCLEIEAKGGIPINGKTDVGFVVSVLDCTEEDPAPVLTHIDSFQEPISVAYQHQTEMGDIEVNMGFMEWIRVGVVIPEILEPPKGGRRELKFVVRMIDLQDPPDIELGFGDGALWTDSLDYVYHHEGKGFQEVSQEQDEGRVLSLRIGMSVAMSDGTLDDSEGLILKNWVTKLIRPYSEERQSELKDLYNSAMRETYQQAKDGSLVIGDITRRLKEIDDETLKLDAIELAYQVMSADGVADSSELAIINKIAESLGVDYEELKKFKDRSILELEVTAAHEQSMEVLLEIDPSWAKEKIDRHLRDLFTKWNGRLNSLAEGSDRQQAQYMLDLIGKCQTKYDSNA